MSTGDDSLPQVTILPEDLRPLRRQKKKVKEYHTDGTLLQFSSATVSGNCQWKIYNRYYGGANEILAAARTVQPGWKIKSIKLL